MKSYTRFIFFLALVFLILSSVLVYYYAKHISSQLQLKQSQIDKLKSIEILTNKININNNEIIKNQQRLIHRKELQIDILKQDNQKPEVAGFTYGDKSISTEELLTIFNNTFKENEQNKAIIIAYKKNYGIGIKKSSGNVLSLDIDSSSIITRYKLSEQKKIDIIKKLIKSNDSLENKSFILDVIQKRYNIPYKFDGKNISISYNKLDSLLDIYPLIKHKIKINERNGKIWIKGL